MAEERSRRPASQYYWGEYLGDKPLQACSQPARGLWHEMNCLMHQGDPYGHLTLNGKPMGVQQLANLCRIPKTVCQRLLDELFENGVPSRDEATGAIYSRRMVRDERRREELAEVGRKNGQKGADFGGLGADHGKKGGRPKKGDDNPGLKPGKKPPQNPPSSSATSSSSSASPIPPAGVIPTPPAAPSVATTPAEESRAGGEESPTAATWRAYELAYERRYKVKPTRNAVVNGQLANFVKRVPQNEAPFIAEFFLLCNDPYYRRTQHSTGALVKDAEALRTRWQTQSTGDPGHVGRQEQVEAGNAELVRRLTNRGPNS